VFITHCHPDHYDLGTLLRFGHDVPIWVPEVARESILSIDMRARLEQLGFTRVRTLRWGDESWSAISASPRSRSTASNRPRMTSCTPTYATKAISISSNTGSGASCSPPTGAMIEPAV